MPSRIEDYALIGDCETAALVGKDGSLDWLCLPSFDSGACFAALLGTPEHGRWLIAPQGKIKKVQRLYRDGTLILETVFETADGAVTLIDGMAIRDEHPVLIRSVRGERGQVPMRLHLVIRFDFGSIVPWVTRMEEGGIRAVAGPDTLKLHTKLPLHGYNHSTVAEFTVSAGEEVPFMLTWRPSHENGPPAGDLMKPLRKAELAWRKWSRGCRCKGPWAEAMLRSLITL
jgi:GH15 family glucan-1,4-alpha-glucosidase